MDCQRSERLVVGSSLCVGTDRLAEAAWVCDGQWRLARVTRLVGLYKDLLGRCKACLDNAVLAA